MFKEQDSSRMTEDYAPTTTPEGVPGGAFLPTTDLYEVFADVSGADREVWDRARAIAAYPGALDRINQAWEAAEYPLEIVARLAEAGLLTTGVDIPGYQQMSPLAAGLVHMELARYDGSVATVVAVQPGLAMRSIAMLGSEEQKQAWLPRLASGELLGAFGLTEPDHGSDAVALETTARRDGDEWVINGAKRWIGNGSVGHLTVVWARTENGGVSGFLVEQHRPGYVAETITGKVSMRAIPQAHITLTDVRVPLSAQLPGARSFRDIAGILRATRIEIAWASFGHAIACYEAAVHQATTRIQFGRPLAANQQIQQRLGDMLGDLVAMALYCRRLAELEAASGVSEAQASLAKVQNTRRARRIAADARDMLGGNGILLENDVVRHMADIEALHTYEGTDSIQSLIIGRSITGLNAFGVRPGGKS
ncbi:glutaryl-CoA dehydrogenase [Raineyella antarctica]|uniref:Glutaryl-CoA dehydrogenase n=1 Tax=Raineyella antarctica TaxID=1577474 RepID=A0A1G6GK84_9ACTN|nr:acyl-CoA dehydrogenase family protein [Raineyella antarctica]SDB81586.1 glutaryl-CoA dehydrogenase [Raineyella antarctica]